MDSQKFDGNPNHSLCRTAELRTGYSDAAYGPSITLCTLRLGGLHSSEDFGGDAEVGLERSRPGCLEWKLFTR